MDWNNYQFLSILCKSLNMSTLPFQKTFVHTDFIFVLFSEFLSVCQLECSHEKGVWEPSEQLSVVFSSLSIFFETAWQNGISVWSQVCTKLTFIALCPCLYPLYNLLIMLLTLAQPVSVIPSDLGLLKSNTNSVIFYIG